MYQSRCVLVTKPCASIPMKVGKLLILDFKLINDKRYKFLDLTFN